jgi:hypothetical protein
MKKLLNLIVLTAIAGAMCACGGPSAEGGDVPKNVSDQYQKLGDAARAAGGNYDSLSDADKKAFVDRAGSEDEARKMVSLMAGNAPTLPGGKGK